MSYCKDCGSEFREYGYSGRCTDCEFIYRHKMKRYAQKEQEKYLKNKNPKNSLDNSSFYGILKM